MTIREQQEAYARGLSELLTTAMTHYASALRWIEFFLGNQDDAEAKAQMERYSRNLGLELIVYLRTYESSRSRWLQTPELDPRPLLPLARSLADSYALMGLIDTAETARAMPLVTFEETAQLYTEDARAYLSRFLDEVPVLAELA